MLSKEQSFMIKVLRDFINNTDTDMPEGIDISLLRIYAKKHEVLGIIYKQTKIPEFITAYSSTIYANVTKKNLLSKLTSLFDFPYFIVKGFSVAELYPIPELRTMGDIDLVIHTQDRSKMHELLLAQGYDNVSRFSNREWQYYKNNIEIELHDHLIYPEAVNNNKQEEFFNDYWKYVNNNRLDWNFHFLFLISHLRKHFMNEGVGFRQFMDLAVVIKYSDLDWKWIEDKAYEIELLPFLKTVLAFCTRWFGIFAPINIPKLDDEFFEISTEKIFADGVFGFENEENIGSAAVNEYLRNGKLGMIIKAVRVLFPSYEELSNVAQYDFIKGKLYLLPIVWIYRLIFNRKKLNFGIRRIKESLATNKQIDEREALYKKWGL